MQREPKNKREGQFAYAEIVHRAKLDLKCKALLWHYTVTFNWKNRNPSYYTQDQICAYVSMSPSTYQKARKRLLKLGWIVEQKISRELPVFVSPQVGRNDPEYDKKSWSKGHKENVIRLEDALASLPDEFRDPLGERKSPQLDSNYEDN